MICKFLCQECSNDIFLIYGSRYCKDKVSNRDLEL